MRAGEEGGEFACDGLGRVEDVGDWRRGSGGVERVDV